MTNTVAIYDLMGCWKRVQVAGLRAGALSTWFVRLDFGLCQSRAYVALLRS